MQLIYCYILFLDVYAVKDIRILCFDYEEYFVFTANEIKLWKKAVHIRSQV